MTKIRLMLSVRPTITGRYYAFSPGTQKITGWKARWDSVHGGTRFYESRRFDTEQEAATAGYRWFDRQGGAYEDATGSTLAPWYRKPEGR